MKRYVIWAKGDYFSFDKDKTRIDMDADAVALPESKVPIHWSFNHNDLPRGYMSDIRVADGEIIGLPHFLDSEAYTEEFLDKMQVGFGGYYSDVVKSEDGSRVLSCTLKGVSLVVWDDMPSRQGKQSREEGDVGPEDTEGSPAGDSS